MIAQKMPDTSPLTDDSWGVFAEKKEYLKCPTSGKVRNPVSPVWFSTV